MMSSPALGSLIARAINDSEPVKEKPVAEEEEFYSSTSLLLVCILLALSLWTSYYLQIKKIRTVHETLVSIFAGMLVGLVVTMSPGTIVREMLTFKHTIFFNLLLPPIILNSGYELKQENFFRNFGSILTFAFMGTFISAVGVGMLVYIYSFLGIESLEIPWVECLMFGATLSATDPVTILSIFNQYRVDPKLYTVIFGESLLNDAVSIVMYDTLAKFDPSDEISLSSIFYGMGLFLLSFGFSMALGVMFGLAMSLTLKHSSLSMYPAIETCLVALSAYTCYFLSNCLPTSGIVSLLFCGITLKHYAYHTMSRRTQRATKYIFSTVAQLTENFIFIYLGMALFTSAPTSVKITTYIKPIFIIISTVAVIATRYAAVFPLSNIINLFHRHARKQRHEELPHSYQMMLFWAGLRGAVGVALAAGFNGANAHMLRFTVLVVVVVTVLLFGGTTAKMLEVLGIQTGVEDEAESSDDEGAFLFIRGGGSSRHGRHGRIDDGADSPSYRNARGGAGRIGSHYMPRHYNHQHRHPQHQPFVSDIHNGELFAANSSDSDSEGEVLPLAQTIHDTSSVEPNGKQGAVSGGDGSQPTSPAEGDGKWFQALDERYLLPLFSNATASRTFHARRAKRTSSAPQAGSVENSNSHSPAAGGTPAESEDEESQEIELGAPGTRQSIVLGRGAMDNQRVERTGSPRVSSPGIRGGSNNGSGERLS